MSEIEIVALEVGLAERVDGVIPAHPTQDIHAALDVAQWLESQGFDFSLRDMCAKSMYDCMWRASFSKGGMKFEAENSESAIAVCVAALDALKGGISS